MAPSMLLARLNRSCVLSAFPARAAIFLPILFSCVASGASIETASRERIAAIAAQYGVRIETDYDRDHFFPASWRRSHVNAQGEQVDQRDVGRLITLVEKFLERYPQELLAENLDTIYLLQRIRFFGKSYGGTYGRKALYIASGNERGPHKDDFIASRLHSEFSSILMSKFEFPKDDWESLNPPKFKYSGTGIEVLGRSKLYGQSVELLEQGFLVRYSTSSLENDFNMISARLLTQPENLSQLCKKYPTLAAKRELAIQFYLANAKVDLR
jgi:hypothetical protein